MSQERSTQRGYEISELFSNFNLPLFSLHVRISLCLYGVGSSSWVVTQAGRQEEGRGRERGGVTAVVVTVRLKRTEFCKELVNTVFFNLDQSCYTHVYTHTGPLLSTSTLHLPPTLLDIKRMRDVNSTKRAQATVKCLEFHPTASVALTAGWHKTLDLFQVDGEVNPKLQSVHVQDFPISTAHFTRDGTEVVMAGERKSYYVYDMMAGKITRVYGIRGKEVSLSLFLPPSSCSTSLSASLPPSLPPSLPSPSSLLSLHIPD